MLNYYSLDQFQWNLNQNTTLFQETSSMCWLMHGIFVFSVPRVLHEWLCDTEPYTLAIVTTMADYLGVSPTQDFVASSTIDNQSSIYNASLALPTNPVYNATDELYHVTPGIVVLLSFLYGSISLLSVVGNLLVIVVIARNKSMHTVTNFYIANLAVADVLIGIFATPFQFQAALLQRWDLPHILCPVAPFFKEMTVNVSICTLTVISIDRYFAVMHPLKPRCSWGVARVVMVLVWLFSIGSAIPLILVFRVAIVETPTTYKPFCQADFVSLFGMDTGKFYWLYLNVVQYFFPLCIICYAYFRIMYRIWGNRAPGSAMDSRDQMLNKNKRKVSRTLSSMQGCVYFRKREIYLSICSIISEDLEKIVLEIILRKKTRTR